jgi:hypothetical protein
MTPAQRIRHGVTGHSWIDIDADWRPTYGIPMMFACELCGSLRRDTVAGPSDGRLLNRRYWYPASYKYRKGERPSRTEYRTMLLAQRVQEARARRNERVTA